MPILTIQQSLDISEVKNIVVTPIVQDLDTGMFIRELRIFGKPIDSNDAQGPLLLVLRLSAGERVNIHIAVPASEF